MRCAPVLLAAFGLAVSFTSALSMERLDRQKRQSRANVQGCTLNPPGIDQPDRPAPDNSIVEITCNTDTAFNLCTFEHLHPMYENAGNNGNQNEEHSITCNMAGVEGRGSKSESCQSDTRITMQATDTTCGIRISNPTPEDTGRWFITVVETHPGGAAQTNNAEKLIYTYNETVLMMQQQRGEQEINRDIEVWYNWDQDEEEWRAGTGANEKVELRCLAQFGRPTPTITWHINRDQNNDLSGERIFTIREQNGNTHDPNGYIKDWQSDIDFEVSTEFLDYLFNTHSININPENGQFSFDLTCHASQGDNGEYHEEDITTRITVKRVYFTDTLRGETIGMIVGIVLAVLLLIVVCLVLIFLKATERLCFADNDQSYRYHDPKSKRAQPHNAQR